MSPAVAAGASLALSLLFVAVYGTTNWLTSLRTDVGTWYFAWERAIPFVPPMILPYVSIDLFFVAAPFLCRDRAELRILTRRVALAIVVAGICFLLFPLRFAFARPAASGWLGAIFDVCRTFDQPFNLVPSLHVALAAILGDLYRRHTGGVLHAAVTAWFALIVLSAVLTHQHHVVDIAGGFVLALACFYCVRGVPWRLPVAANRRVGGYYALGSAAVTMAALGWPYGALLLWPAASLAIVAAAYAGLGPGVFRKARGFQAASS